MPQEEQVVGVLLAEDFCARDFPSQPTVEGSTDLHPAYTEVTAKWRSLGVFCVCLGWAAELTK